ncbi:TPA: hypothetical protein ACXEM2_002438 [Enterobacter hormaechei]
MSFSNSIKEGVVTFATQDCCKHLQTLSPHFSKESVGRWGFIQGTTDIIISGYVFFPTSLANNKSSGMAANGIFQPRILRSQRRSSGFRLGQFIAQTISTVMRATATSLERKSAVAIKNIIFFGNHDVAP